MATKFTGWQNIRTIQSTEILTELLEAKENRMAKMLICNTGMGKTHTVNLFCKNNSAHTYKITVGATYRLIHVLHELCDVLGLKKYTSNGNAHISIRDISKALADISDSGGKPMIIIDEAENCKGTTLRAFKQLYDGIHEYSAFVLIGTDQITVAFNRKYEGQSMPQLKRRFKAGTRYITPLNKAKHFKPFFEAHSVPGDVQDMLFDIADNYGELHDYLEPVLRRCASKNIELTKEEFCRYHKLPMTKQFINTKTNAA
jgi:hypothetical protein